MQGRGPEIKFSAFAKYLLGEDVPVSVEPAAAATPAVSAARVVDTARASVSNAVGKISGLFKAQVAIQADLEKAEREKKEEAARRQKEIEIKKATNLAKMHSIFSDYVDKYSPAMISRLFNDLAGNFSGAAKHAVDIPQINAELMQLFLDAHERNELKNENDAVKIIRNSKYWTWVIRVYADATGVLLDEQGNVKPDIAYVLHQAAVESGVMDEAAFNDLLKQDFFKSQLVAGYVTNISSPVLEKLTSGPLVKDNPYSDIYMAATMCLNEISFYIGKNYFDKFVLALRKLKGYPVTSRDQEDMKAVYLENIKNLIALAAGKPAEDSLGDLIQTCEHYCSNLDSQRKREVTSAAKHALRALDDLTAVDVKSDEQKRAAEYKLRVMAETLHHAYMAIRNLSPNSPTVDDLLPFMGPVMAPLVQANHEKYLMNSEFTDKLGAVYASNVFGQLPDFETRKSGDNDYYQEAYVAIELIRSGIVLARNAALLERAAELHPDHTAKNDLILMLDTLMADAKDNPNASEAAQAIAARVDFKKIPELSAVEVLNLIREFKGLPPWQEEEKNDKGKEEATAEDDTKRAAGARRAEDDAKHEAEVALDSAKNKALNIMLRLQMLPPADQMNEITDNIDNFKRALDAFNASIPSGFDAVKFATNLLSVMPVHVELYSDDALHKLDAIARLYNDSIPMIVELWSAVQTTGLKLGGVEDESSKYNLLLHKRPALIEIANENIKWNKEREAAALAAEKERQADAGNAENERKAAALAVECDEYMKHLGREIYEGIRDYDYDLLKKNDEFQLLHRPDANSRIQFRIGHALGDEAIRARVNEIGKRHEKYRLAVEKYEAVRKMKKALIDNTKNGAEKLQAFDEAFQANRGLIEKSRDSAMIFLKKVITVLTAGIAYAAGMWNIKGKQFSDKIDSQLPEKKPGNNKPK